MTALRPVTSDFAVAPQITAEDVAAAAAAGVRLIINNRPDGEQPGQPPGQSIAEAAAAAGVAYLHVPVAGPPGPAQIQAMAAALAEAPGPILAFCRSGTRSITLWAMAQAQAGTAEPDDLIAQAAEVGYDLGGLRPALQRLRQGQAG